MHHFPKLPTALAIATAILLLAACNPDDPCNTPRDGTNYTLSDTARSYANGYVGADKIIFKNTLGEEIAFVVTGMDNVATYQVSLPCDEDPSQTQTVNGTTQVLSYALSNPAVLAQPIIINLVEYPILEDRDAYESLVVTYGALFTNGGGNELFYTYLTGDNPQLTFSDSLVLSGKTFYDVYALTPGGTAPVLDIKYTMNEGVVYIRDTMGGEVWVYERRE